MSETFEDARRDGDEAAQAIIDALDGCLDFSKSEGHQNAVVLLAFGKATGTFYGTFEDKGFREGCMLRVATLAKQIADAEAEKKFGSVGEDTETRH